LLDRNVGIDYVTYNNRNPWDYPYFANSETRTFPRKYENTFNCFARFIPRTGQARRPRLPARKVGIVGFLTNCPGTAARSIGRRCCSRLQVRADALMAAREKRKGRKEERQTEKRERERERERERPVDVISCLRYVVAGLRYIGSNDRPLRAAARYLHALRELSFLYLSSAKFSFRDARRANRHWTGRRTFAREEKRRQLWLSSHT